MRHRQACGACLHAYICAGRVCMHMRGALGAHGAGTVRTPACIAHNSWGRPSQHQGPGPSPWALLGAAHACACPALALINIYCGSSPQSTTSLSLQSSSSDETKGSLSSSSLPGHASSSTVHCTALALNNMAASIIPSASRVDVLCIAKLKANVSSSSLLSRGGHANWDRRYGALGM